MSNYKEYTDKIRDQFVKGIEEKGLKWFAEWTPKFRATNGVSKSQYRGANHLNLSFDGFADSRYFTFKQATQLGYKIKKGAKSQSVIKFAYYDKKTKKNISYSEYDPSNKDHSMYLKYYQVFNAEQLDGIELEHAESINYSDDLIAKIAKAMGVDYKVGTTYKAPCYIPSSDRIEIPTIKLFKSQKSLLATGLHELSHATAVRTSRGLNTYAPFGSESYAFEELVAEMSAALLCSYLGIENTVDKNHIAYVKSWISHIKDNSKSLIDAFKFAEESANYILDVAGLLPETVVETTTEVVEEKPIAKSKSKKSKSAKAEVKPTPKPIPTEVKEVAKEVTKARSSMTQFWKNGILYDRYEKENAFIEMPHSEIEKLNKHEKAKFIKLWA